MKKFLLKKILNCINIKLKTDLTVSCQMPIKNNFERQVGYICIDKLSKCKYWLTLAFSEAQKYRLKETVMNITENSSIFHKYFYVNMPIISGECDGVVFVLYKYIENAQRAVLNDTSFDILLNKIYERYKLCTIIISIQVFHLTAKILREIS